MATTPGNKPNGVVICFFGNATSCEKHALDKQDYQHATQRSDGAKWATSAQSGTVIDRTQTVFNGTYRGWE